MIRVTVELLPGGREDIRETLGTAEIWNDLEDTMETDGRRGSYGFRIWRKVARPWREGRVTGFPRKSKGAWELLARCLEEAGVR